MSVTPIYPIRYNTHSTGTWAGPVDFTQAGGITGEGDSLGAYDETRKSNVPYLLTPGANEIPFGRPGTIYKGQVMPSLSTMPPLEVELIYDRFSKFHPLIPTFNSVRDLAAGDSAQKYISFKMVPIDAAMITARGILPRVVKKKRDGQVMIYTGATNAGALYDWIINDAYLNHCQTV